MTSATRGKTNFANINRWVARLLLLALLGLAVFPVCSHTQLHIPGERKWGQPSAKATDADLYQQIVKEIESGRGYYAAAAAEHRLRGYPTSPPQVFREPALAWFLTLLHLDFLRTAALFGLLGAILVRLFKEMAATGKSFPVRVTVIVVATTGLSVAGVAAGAYWHEVWAALLIALSLLTYRATSWWPAVVLGLLACLVRELAAPYLLVMAGFALYEKQVRQFSAWCGAFVLFAIAYAVHLAFASELSQSGDIISGSWLALGGWNFAIATAKWNILLHALPEPLVALAMCFGIVGLAGAFDDRAQRAAAIVAGYVAGFLIVGRPENYYWGILYAPLLPIGFLFAPSALRELLYAASSSTRG